MDDQTFKNQCTLERTIVWLINTLESNLRWFDPSEKKMIPEKIFWSPFREKVIVETYHLEKYTLRKKPLEKIIIRGPLEFLRPYPCIDKR